MKKDIDSTSKLVKPVDSTANQINAGSEIATTPKTVVNATALVKGKKSSSADELSLVVILDWDGKFAVFS